MKNRVINLTTKVAGAMLMAGLIVGTASTIARADDGTNVYEEPVYAELVPEAQLADSFDNTECIEEVGYEPIIQTERVSDANVIIDDPEPEPEIVYNDETTIRAELVPDAQFIDDLNKTEFISEDGYEPIIRTELVPEEAPYINNAPALNKEIVPTAPVILDAAPEEVEQEKETPGEAEVDTKESKPASKSSFPKTFDELPYYGNVKQCYFEHGAGTAFTEFIYYCPSPIGYDAIEQIEKEIREGNYGYTIDGVYYDRPENDPYFAGRQLAY